MGRKLLPEYIDIKTFIFICAGGKERKKERKTFLVDLLGGIYSENKHISPKLL